MALRPAADDDELSAHQLVQMIIEDTADGLARVYREVCRPKINLNRPDSESRYTALHAAVLANNPALVYLLLDLGADVDVQSKWGETPLMIAANQNFEDILEALLERGADPNVKDKGGKTALRHARDRDVDNSHNYIIQTLKDAMRKALHKPKDQQPQQHTEQPHKHEPCCSNECTIS